MGPATEAYKAYSSAPTDEKLVQALQKATTGTEGYDVANAAVTSKQMEFDKLEAQRKEAENKQLAEQAQKNPLANIAPEQLDILRKRGYGGEIDQKLFEGFTSNVKSGGLVSEAETMAFRQKGFDVNKVFGDKISEMAKSFEDSAKITEEQATFMNSIGRGSELTSNFGDTIAGAIREGNKQVTQDQINFVRNTGQQDKIDRAMLGLPEPSAQAEAAAAPYAYAGYKGSGLSFEEYDAQQEKQFQEAPDKEFADRMAKQAAEFYSSTGVKPTDQEYQFQTQAGLDQFMQQFQQLTGVSAAAGETAAAATKEVGEMTTKNMTVPQMTVGNLIANNTNTQGFAAGGIVVPNGISKPAASDTMLARLTPGEFVMTKEAVNTYGNDFFEGLNRGYVGFNSRDGLDNYITRGRVTPERIENVRNSEQNTMAVIHNHMSLNGPLNELGHEITQSMRAELRELMTKVYVENTYLPI